jgi:hypothetical protein
MIELVDEKLMQFLQTYPIAQGSKNKMKWKVKEIKNVWRDL